METDFILFQETDANRDQVQHIWMRAARCVFGCLLLSTFVGRVDFLYTYRPQVLRAFQSGSDRYSPCQTRHLDYLLQFTSDICFIKGCENLPANTMSRGINALLLDQRFVEEQTKDQQLQQLLQDNTISPKLSKTHVPSMDLEIMCDTSTGRLCLFVPETLRKMFSFMHDLSHPCANVSIQLVSDRFVRPWMKAEIQQWVKACVLCQKAKVGRYTRSPFESFPSPEEWFAHMHVDITGPLLFSYVRINHIY